MTGQGIPPKAQGEEGNIALLLVRNIDRTVNRLHQSLDFAGQATQLGQLGAEYLHRDVRAVARQHVVDTVGDRLADHDLGTRNAGEVGPQRRQKGFLAALPHLQGHFHFRRRHVHRVRIALGPAGSTGGSDHFRMGQQDLLDLLAQAIGLLQRGARQRGGTDRQRPFVEIRQKGPACEAQRNQGCHQGKHTDQRHPLPAGQRCVQHAPVAALDGMQKARLHVLADDLRAWQDERRQYRRNGDRHQQRSGKGDNVGKAQWHHQPAFHTGEKEERHEHQHDDQSRKHDGALDLAGGIENHLQDGVLFALGLGQVIPQTPDDVLHHDDGVVHQGTKGNRHAAQGHGVDGGPECLHRQDGSDQ